MPTSSTFCYIRIFVTLSHYLTQVQEEAHQKPNGGGPLLNIRRYRKTALTAFISIAALTEKHSPTFDDGDYNNN